MHNLITWFVDTTVGPFTVADIAGFVTGALCVWLVVRQHIANFPIGLVNNVFFFILFADAALYADAGLQVIYFGLGIAGWWWWLHGGAGRTVLRVSRITRAEILGGLAFFVVGTVVLRAILLEVNGAAPLVDAATAVGSLIAQYLLTRKRIESWYVWITVDVIYVPLYFSRDLPLTGVLYFGFIGLCIAGLREWRAAERQALAEDAAVPGGLAVTP